MATCMSEKLWCMVARVHLQTTHTGNVGQPFGTALDYGAGHVDPAKALNPGLGKELHDNGLQMPALYL
jgi:hypothetical protein